MLVIMLSQTVLLATLLGAAPPESPTQITTSTDGEVCSPAVPEPQRLEAQPFASTSADGTPSWGASATYQLSSGEIGEAFMVLDSEGAGEAQLMIDGEIIAHVAVTMDSEGRPSTTTWYPPAVSHPPELLAEMMQVDLPRIVAESLPQELKCSDWGKKVMKAGKYMSAAIIGATGAACCLASQGIACIACGAGVAVGIMAVDEFADGYCD